MPRTKGALNKSKFISVSINEIQKNFHPDALVRIDASYAVLFENPVVPKYKPVEDKKDDGIEFVLTVPKN